MTSDRKSGWSSRCSHSGPPLRSWVIRTTPGLRPLPRPVPPGTSSPPQRAVKAIRLVCQVLACSPPPTSLTCPLPGTRPIGRSVPSDRSRSALVFSQHLDGFLQRQGRRHIAARYRPGFTALARCASHWQASWIRTRSRSATTPEMHSSATQLLHSDPKRALGRLAARRDGPTPRVATHRLVRLQRHQNRGLYRARPFVFTPRGVDAQAGPALASTP